MKRVLVFVVLLSIAILIFFGITFFLNRQTGKGALQVTSDPKSKVFLDDKLIGTTSFCACDSAGMLSVGDYTIKLVPLNGKFSPYEAKITISRGTLTAVDRIFAENGSSDGSVVSLIPAGDEKDIEILVVSMPGKANVFLDSNPVGITPLLLKGISNSDHDLRLTLDGYKDKSIRIKTALGFRLSALVFLGVKTDLSASVEASVSAALSQAIVTVTKVLILDTPTGFLRVRGDSSINSSEIAQVKPGESYDLISEKEGWFEIKLTNDIKGWISSSYAIKK